MAANACRIWALPRASGPPPMASLIGDVLLIGCSGPLPPPPPQAVRIQAAKSAAHTGKNFILWLPFVCTPTGQVPGRCNQIQVRKKTLPIRRAWEAIPRHVNGLFYSAGDPTKRDLNLIAGLRLFGTVPVSTRKDWKAARLHRNPALGTRCRVGLRFQAIRGDPGSRPICAMMEHSHTSSVAPCLFVGRIPIHGKIME